MKTYSVLNYAPCHVISGSQAHGQTLKYVKMWGITKQIILFHF